MKGEHKFLEWFCEEPLNNEFPEPAFKVGWDAALCSHKHCPRFIFTKDYRVNPENHGVKPLSDLTYKQTTRSREMTDTTIAHAVIEVLTGMWQGVFILSWPGWKMKMAFSFVIMVIWTAMLWVPV